MKILSVEDHHHHHSAFFSFQPSDAENLRIFPTGSWRENVKHSGAGPSYNSLSVSSEETLLAGFPTLASLASLCLVGSTATVRLTGRGVPPSYRSVPVMPFSLSSPRKISPVTLFQP